jgi:FKBP-type peptidyl-prolyl cis-trans isomerase
MKLKIILTTGLIAATSAVYAQEVKLNIPGKTDAPAPAAGNVTATPAPAGLPESATPAALAAAKFSEAQIIETFGWFLAGRIGLHELGFSPEQIQFLAKGIASAAAGKDAPYELAQIGPIMNEYIQQRQEAAVKAMRDHNLGESAKFFTALKQQAGVKVLPSGLAYEMLKAGSGASPNATDTVTIHYTGALLDGRVFDTTAQRGEPIEIPLNQVIPGWTEGVQQLNKGAKAKLYIPPHLAYGDEGAGEIPPGAALVFEVELLDFKPTPPAPEAPTPAAPITK